MGLTLFSIPGVPIGLIKQAFSIFLVHKWAGNTIRKQERKLVGFLGKTGLHLLPTGCGSVETWGLLLCCLTGSTSNGVFFYGSQIKFNSVETHWTLCVTREYTSTDVHSRAEYVITAEGLLVAGSTNNNVTICFPNGCSQGLSPL
jgi:hypothetical protein